MIISDVVYGNGLDKNTYQNLHNRIRRIRGKASEHTCIICGGNFYMEWAQLRDADPFDVSNYIPMCHKHHMQYDHGSNTIEIGAK